MSRTDMSLYSKSKPGGSGSNEELDEPLERSIPNVPVRSPIRFRYLFTTPQLEYLEKAFERNSHATPEERKRISLLLNIPEKNITTWFQNRRAKQRHVSRRIEKQTLNTEVYDPSKFNNDKKMYISTANPTAHYENLIKKKTHEEKAQTVTSHGNQIYHAIPTIPTQERESPFLHEHFTRAVPRALSIQSGCPKSREVSEEFRSKYKYLLHFLKSDDDGCSGDQQPLGSSSLQRSFYSTETRVFYDTKEQEVPYDLSMKKRPLNDD